MPTPDQVREAIELVRKRGANLAYFFGKLVSPEWIKPLSDEGFFRDPPPAERLGDLVRFPVWPQSRYLARMARKEPELVHDVLLEIPSSDNQRVHEDLLEAATEMPPNIGKDIAAKEAEWIASQEWIDLLLPEKGRRLVRHLAEGGEVGAAINLWTTLLSLRDTPGKPTARLRAWDYAEVLRLTIPPLAAADPLGTLRVMRDLLKTAVDKQTDDGDGKIDYSAIWRPAIDESDDRQTHENIEDALVSATRDCAVQAAGADPSRLKEVVEILLAGESTIFTRLVLYLLSECPDVPAEVLDRFLCDPELFDNWLVRHEYVLLMRTAFGSASSDCQQSILGWIETGPAPEKSAERLSRGLAREPTADEVDEYKRRWQRDRLSPIAEYLEHSWLERYQRLIGEFGEVSDPDFLAFRFIERWEPVSSPKSLEQLREMSVDGLVGYLRSWEPSDDPMGSSEEGLAGVVRRLAGEDGARLSAGADLFAGLRPAYVRELLTGLGTYLEKGPIDWQATLTLAQWVAAERSAEAQQEEDYSKDNWLRWAADAALELIRDGMAKSDSGLTIEHREAVWRVISQLTDDPEPTPSHEQESLESTEDALTLSLNTTRGKAMHALMVYIVWVTRSLRDDASTSPDTGLLIHAPEAAEALEQHLDLDQDPSLAIRAVYGRCFPWLVAVDREWSSRYASAIFARDPGLRRYWDAAWSSYLTTDTLNRNVFQILNAEYRHAVALLGSESAVKGARLNPEERLAQHMMLLYLNGDLELEDGSLLVDFYARASDGVRAHALDFVGRISGNDGFTEKMRSRAVFLWDARLAEARAEPENHKEEIKAFGWWTGSQGFDQKWTVDNLESALEFGVGVDVQHKVAQFLAEVAPKWPTKAVRCLRYLIKSDKEGWGVYAWRESARSVLSTGLENEESQELTKQVIGELLALGHFDYRDLLPNRTS